MSNAGIVKGAERELETVPLDLGEYRSFLRGSGLRDSTVNNYARYLTGLRDMVPKDPRDYTLEDLVRLRRTDQWCGYAEGTRGLYRSCLRHYWAMTQRYDLLNPTLDFWKVPRGNGRNRASYTKEHTLPQGDREALLEHCQDAILHSRSAAVVWRAFTTWIPLAYGLRSYAVSHLRVCDLDIASRVVNVVEDKGGKPHQVYMDVDASPYLARFLEMRERTIRKLCKRNREDPDTLGRLLDLKDDPEGPLLFNKSRSSRKARVGAPMTPRGVGSVFRALSRQVLGKPWGPHSARHAKAYNLLVVQKKDPLAVKEYLNHANLQTTIGYITQGVEEQRAAFEGGSTNSTPTPKGTEAPAASGHGVAKAYLVLLKAGRITQEEFITKTEGLL